jgi:hypothetical protein
MFKRLSIFVGLGLLALTLAIILAARTSTSGYAAVQGNATISGVVWQDFCLKDCVAGSNLGKRGNGLVSTAEVRLQGIKVGLAKGKCRNKPPTQVIQTNKNGFYLISGLSKGYYCVTVDSRQSNTAFPKPGYWTRPSPSAQLSVARYQLLVNGPANFVNISFGWNYY